MKTKLNDLAIFGGAPAFETKVHVGSPNIGNRDQLLRRINDILDRRWLTNGGPYVREFEDHICHLLGVKHCVATCNGTLALQIAIKALGLSGEVIVPSFTFVATAHALQWQEITPIFCDVDPTTYNVAPREVERVITPLTTGILGVHLWGRPCEIEALTDMAKHYNLKLMFDASHAFGCSHQGLMIGNFGDAEVFSFHATKYVNTFEGGAVVTNSEQLATRLRLMRNFGFSAYDQVDSIGINAKMSEVSAAMGLTSLESISEFVDVNYRYYKLYQDKLCNVSGLRLMRYDEIEKQNYQHIVIEVEEGITNISRDQLIKILWCENIIARRYFYPGCHRMEPYRSLYTNAVQILPETERLTRSMLLLPTGTAVSRGGIESICLILRFVIEHGLEVQQRLQDTDNKIFKTD